MNSTAAIAALSSVLFFLVSCGGGGVSRRTDFGAAFRCPENYSPKSMSLDATGDTSGNSARSKVNWPEGTVSADTLPAGEYTYLGMEFLITDKSTGMVVHAKDEKNSEGEFQGRVVCLRSPSSSPLNATLNLPAVTNIETSGKIAYQTRGLIVEFKEAIEITAVSNPGSEVDAPTKVAEEQKLASELYVVKPTNGSEQSFEVRVSSEDDNFKKAGILRFKNIVK